MTEIPIKWIVNATNESKAVRKKIRDYFQNQSKGLFASEVSKVLRLRPSSVAYHLAFMVEDNELEVKYVGGRKTYKVKTMVKIEYLYTEGKIGDKVTPIPVRVDGVRTGTIKFVEENGLTGWAYYPKGHKKLRGEIFPTVDLVQKSLKDEFE